MIIVQIHFLTFTALKQHHYAEVKEENLRWGNSIFSMDPQPRGRGPPDTNASEYSTPYLPATSNCRQLFCTRVVVRSYTTVPVAFRLPLLCILWTWRWRNDICQESEVQERRSLASRGHFNHCYYGLTSWEFPSVISVSCRLMQKTSRNASNDRKQCL